MIFEELHEKGVRVHIRIKATTEYSDTSLRNEFQDVMFTDSL